MYKFLLFLVVGVCAFFFLHDLSIPQSLNVFTVVKLLLGTFFILNIFVLIEAGIFEMKKSNLYAWIYFGVVNFVILLGLTFTNFKFTMLENIIFILLINPCSMTLLGISILKNPLRYNQKLCASLCLWGLVIMGVHSNSESGFDIKYGNLELLVFLINLSLVVRSSYANIYRSKRTPLNSHR